MPSFKMTDLISITTDIFTAAGVSEDTASLVAELLVEANLCGHDSHGVIRVPQYLNSIKTGDINPSAEVEIKRNGNCTALIDGHWNFGQVIMNQAVEMAIEKAETHGLAGIAINQANHIGRLGSYVETIARHDMIGILYVNAVGAPAYRMAPWGGTEPRLATDPLAKGIPTSNGDPIVIDMTTTVVAEGKVRLKRNRKEQTPVGWLLDAEGNSTTDPNSLYANPSGSIQPLGGIAAGYKGYGLNIAIELLAGALSGTGCVGKKGQRLSNGVMLLAISIAEFCDLQEFFEESDRFIAFVKSSKPSRKDSKIQLPGEVELLIKNKRMKNGIVIDEETWAQICNASSDFGLII